MKSLTQFIQESQDKNFEIEFEFKNKLAPQMFGLIPNDAVSTLCDAIEDLLNDRYPHSTLDRKNWDNTGKALFGFYEKEFDLDKLKEEIEKNDNLITLQILKKCQIQPRQKYK